MNFLLKILQGPNAGAEVALVEGLCIKVGRADTCDLVLADPTLPEVACEIDTSAEGVMLFLPGGVRERMEPFHVRFFGSTALAVGPADAPWGELVYPAQQTAATQEAGAEAPVVAATEAPAPAKKSRGFLWALDLILVLLFVILVLAALWYFRGPLKEAWQRFRTSTPVERVVATVAPRSLSGLAVQYHLELRNAASGDVLAGNLKTRAERLQVAAEAYSIQPYVTLELSDDESLRTGVEEVLAMLTEGQMSVFSVENRQVALQGKVVSAERLKKILEAMNADVPHIEGVDCSRVVADATLEPVRPAQVAAAKAKAPEPNTFAGMPFCGILATPYPCLVLRNGTRLMEGAEVGGFVIETIAPDHVMLKDKGGTLLPWYP